jgi:hypothetical protein
VRADEEMADGIIQKPMFERLILCEYAVADLTAANANVFYALGVRHAVRPGCTDRNFGTICRPFSLRSSRAIGWRGTGCPGQTGTLCASFHKSISAAIRCRTASSDALQAFRRRVPAVGCITMANCSVGSTLPDMAKSVVPRPEMAMPPRLVARPVWRPRRREKRSRFR